MTVSTSQSFWRKRNFRLLGEIKIFNWKPHGPQLVAAWCDDYYSSLKSLLHCSKMGHSRPLFSLFLSFQYSCQYTNVQYKFCQWLDSNLGPLVLRATALPTEPQPRSYTDTPPLFVSMAALLMHVSTFVNGKYRCTAHRLFKLFNNYWREIIDACYKTITAVK